MNLSHLDSDSHIVNPGPQSRAPGSLLRDVDPITTAISKRRRSQLHLPLPSSEGCGRLLVEVGGPSSASRKWATTFVIACFLPFLLCQPTTNARYTHSAMTTTSLASKCEPEVDFLDCSSLRRYIHVSIPGTCENHFINPHPQFPTSQKKEFCRGAVAG